VLKKLKKKKSKALSPSITSQARAGLKASPSLLAML